MKIRAFIFAALLFMSTGFTAYASTSECVEACVDACVQADGTNCQSSCVSSCKK